MDEIAGEEQEEKKESSSAFMNMQQKLFDFFSSKLRGDYVGGTPGGTPGGPDETPGGPMDTPGAPTEDKVETGEKAALVADIPDEEETPQ